jgi:hypothetical protein
MFIHEAPPSCQTVRPVLALPWHLCASKLYFVNYCREIVVLEDLNRSDCYAGCPALRHKLT